MNYLKKTYPLLPVLAGLLPLLASAATVGGILTTIQGLIQTIIPILMLVAVAVFLYGVLKYITSGGDAEKEKTARGYIIYGIIGLFVMVAFWGLVTVLSDTFGIDEGAQPITPDVQPNVNY